MTTPLQKWVWRNYRSERVRTQPMDELVVINHEGECEVSVKLTSAPSSRPLASRLTLDGLMYDLKASRAMREVWEEGV